MTTRTGLIVVLLAIAAYFAPRLVGGEVIFPHSNAVQVGAERDAALDEAWGLKFSDESSFYVPELHAHLHAPRSGWIATWTNAVEMGRPLTHLSGFSRAYPPTWLLALVTSDAIVLYTWLVVLTVLATGVFAFLFFRAAELDVWACVFGALSAALGMPVLYWLTFAMNVAGFCWTFACLWLVTSWIARPGAAKLLGIAASVYALLLSGYPQMTVWEGAFVAAWTVARVLAMRSGSGARARALAAIAAAVLLGVACALPVYLDLALASSRSARTAVDPDHFLAVLPDVRGWRGALEYLATLIDPALLGDARTGGYPMRFSGVAFGAAVVVLALVSWRAGRWRTLLTAYAFVAVTLAMVLSPALYRIGVEHLGLGLSRTVPSWGAIVPMILCATVACDTLLVGSSRRPWIVSGLALLVAGLAVAISDGRASSYAALAVGVAGVAALAHARRGWIAVACAFAVAWLASRDFVLMRPRASIRTSSALVDELRQRTNDGSRFAIVGNERRHVLPPNQELLYGLASVHSYDSLSTRAYQDWVRGFSREGARSNGRWFDRITDASKLGGKGLARANLGVVLATEPILGVKELAPEGLYGPLFLHRWTGERWAAQVYARGFELEGGDVALAPDATGSLARIAADEGDRVRIELAPQPSEAVVLLARQFHPQWVALDGHAVRVDDFYQGVRVPPGATSVTLEFRPWVRWAWLSMASFAVAFLVLGARTLARRSKPVPTETAR